MYGLFCIILLLLEATYSMPVPRSEKVALVKQSNSIETEMSTSPRDPSEEIKSDFSTLLYGEMSVPDLSEKSNTQRSKRSLRPPAHLAELLKQSYGKPGLKGEVLYVAKRLGHVDFSLRKKLFRKKNILKAELNIYKKPLKKAKNIHNMKVVHAIVSIHQVISDGQHFGSTKLIDSKLVRVDAKGFIKFDITSSVREWITYKHSNKGLDIWVESIKTGSRAAKIARRFKFEGAGSRKLAKRPALALFFTDGNSKHKKSRSKITKEE